MQNLASELRTVPTTPSCWRFRTLHVAFGIDLIEFLRFLVGWKARLRCMGESDWGRPKRGAPFGAPLSVSQCSSLGGRQPSGLLGVPQGRRGLPIEAPRRGARSVPVPLRVFCRGGLRHMPEPAPGFFFLPLEGKVAEERSDEDGWGEALIQEAQSVAGSPPPPPDLADARPPLPPGRGKGSPILAVRAILTHRLNRETGHPGGEERDSGGR